MARKRKSGSILGLIKDLTLIISYFIEAVGTILTLIGSGIAFLYQVISSVTRKDAIESSSLTESLTMSTKSDTKGMSCSVESTSLSTHSQKTTLGDNNMKGPIQKNQLPNGRYVIGKDIPVGNYDFEALHGSGIIVKHLSETTNEHNYYEFVSLKEENKYLINVDCREGEVLVIPTNMVVAISRSNKVVLDL